MNNKNYDAKKHNSNFIASSKKWLDDACGKNKWHLNQTTGLIDVSGDVEICGQGLIKITYTGLIIYL